MKIEEIEEIKNEEKIDSLMKKKSTKNVNIMHDNTLSFGDKLADRIASFAGSWPFIIGFVSFLVVWILINSIAIFNHFDSFPFILLNLALSCVAALQAPVIMMSQNRQEEKDRIRSEQDYETNMKAEIIIEEIFKHTQKIEQIEKSQNEILKYLKDKYDENNK